MDLVVRILNGNVDSVASRNSKRYANHSNKELNDAINNYNREGHEDSYSLVEIKDGLESEIVKFLLGEEEYRVTHNNEEIIETLEDVNITIENLAYSIDDIQRTLSQLKESYSEN